MTCTNCHKKGHNIKTCKNEKAPPKPKGKRGRPRIHPIQPPRPKKSKGEQTTTSSEQVQTRPRTGFIPPRSTRLQQQNQSSSQSTVTGSKEGPSTQESTNPAGN
ncbi:uncharacterized protein LOC130995694 [Salvia miltiorrhiza]|uniref:uncharacterized protein LOC130995694 n=1 Tax=Salvia miltiorrhiza TaxID=226208 RepID=UPI0025AC5382|nr:uncharacterized protein LOC130995694 [Salvia miltiorrhiza]